MNENKELKNEELKNVTGGEEEKPDPKYEVYKSAQFYYDYEGNRYICAGTIRQYSWWKNRYEYTIECRKYPGGPAGGGMLVVKEEDIICAN